MAIIKYPYTNLHELNLDWIIEQLGKDGPVISINGKNGIVVLTGEDIARAVGSSETIASALSAQGTSLQSVQTKLGVTPLPTIAQTVTGAIAENTTDIANLDDTMGSTALPTTAQTVTGAIAEHESDIGTLTTEMAKKANIQSKAVQANTSETFPNLTAGSLIFISRYSVSLYALYMVDLVGTITLIAGSNPTTSLTLENGTLTVVNESAAWCSCTVIIP